MPSLAFAALTFVAILASGLAGFAFGRALPESHVSDRSRAMIGGAAGLVGLMLALTLALSIVNAYGVTQDQKAAVQRLAVEALAFNAAMKSFGPEGAEARRLIGAELALTDALLRGRPIPASAAAANVAAMDAALAGLKPTTDAQRERLSAAQRLYERIAESRLAMAMPLPDPLSGPLLLTLVCWACLVFLGLGALSRANLTTLPALALGGGAVASAIYLVLELSQPLSGSFRFSPSLIGQTLMEIAQ